MLDPVQRKELIAALVSAFPNLPAFDLMLVTRVNQNRERISPVAALPDVATAVVNRAEDEFWTPELIAGAWSAQPGNPLLQQFLNAHPALRPGSDQATPVNHFEARFFVGRRVFLCRQNLRDNLRAFGQGTNSRVMVVTGERGTGKTYSKDFVGFLLQFNPAMPLSRNILKYIDLDQNVTNLESLAKTLGRAFNLDPETLPRRDENDKEQDSRWLPKLYAWLCDGVLGGAHDAWWLVLDGFQQTLPPEGLDLIDMLANFADTETTRLRLLLLNYPRPDSLPFWTREDIPSPLLKREDIETFVASVFTLSGATPKDELVKQTADEIETQVQKELDAKKLPTWNRLRLTSLAMTRTAQRLLRAAP